MSNHQNLSLGSCFMDICNPNDFKKWDCNHPISNNVSAVSINSPIFRITASAPAF